jgi:hypothetical protein
LPGKKAPQKVQAYARKVASGKVASDLKGVQQNDVKFSRKRRVCNNLILKLIHFVGGSDVDNVDNVRKLWFVSNSNEELSEGLVSSELKGVS